MKPEDGKFYESRDAVFNERLVYGDKYNKDSIKNWQNDVETIDKEKWFSEFEKEDEEEQELKESEGVPKRKRGRPRKENVQTSDSLISKETLTFEIHQ